MSLTGPSCQFSLSRFPRVSGDEPDDLETHGCVAVFSPRERG